MSGGPPAGQPGPFSESPACAWCILCRRIAAETEPQMGPSRRLSILRCMSLGGVLGAWWLLVSSFGLHVTIAWLTFAVMTSSQRVISTTSQAGGLARGRLRQNGAAIRSLREKDGWHQPDFAKLVGVSQAALSNIEREKRGARPATIYRIARVLRVPVAAITREYEEPDRSAV